MYANSRFLIVDDSNTIQKRMNQILKKLEIEDFDMASNGGEALAKLDEAIAADNAFKLILCDWNMPDMLGIDVLRKVRAHVNPVIANMKFIMITSSNDKIAEAMKTGANNVVTKPLDEEALQMKLRLVLGG